MPWFLIWTLLIVVSVAVMGLLLYSLWLKARDLTEEISRAGDVFERLMERTEELNHALAQAERKREEAKLELTDHVGAKKRVKQLRKERLRRKERWRANHRNTYSRWRSIGADARYDRWRKP